MTAIATRALLATIAIGAIAGSPRAQQGQKKERDAAAEELARQQVARLRAAIERARLVQADPKQRKQGPAEVELDPTRAKPTQRVWLGPKEGDRDRLGFRRRFELPKGVTAVRIVTSCDNECAVWLNGEKLGSLDTWEKVLVLDSNNVKTGANVIAIEAKNHGSAAGMVAWVLWTEADGTKRELGTDKTWRVALEPKGAWTAPKFADAKWEAANERGAVTFGKNVYSYPAQGIEFRNPRASAAAAIETALEKFRKAPNAKAAQDALREIEIAVMAARQQVWREVDGKKRKPTQTPESKSPRER